jgi:hypothetical protein
MTDIYTRALRTIGRGRWFAIGVKHAGSKLDKALYRTSRGRLTLTGRTAPTMLLTTRGRKTARGRCTKPPPTSTRLADPADPSDHRVGPH